MPRWLGLDVGDKRVGVALSDPLLMLASPVGVFERGKHKAETRILQLLSQYQVTKVVIGLPLSEDGEEHAQCAKVRAFCRRLARRSNVEMTYVDEYATTLTAKERLLEVDIHYSPDTASKTDAAAACLILQEALDLHHRQQSKK